MVIVDERYANDISEIGNFYYTTELQKAVEKALGEELIWFDKDTIHKQGNAYLGVSVPKIKANEKSYFYIELIHSVDFSMDMDENFVYVLSKVELISTLDNSVGTKIAGYGDAKGLDFFCVVENGKAFVGEWDTESMSDLGILLNQTRVYNLETPYTEETVNIMQVGINQYIPLPTYVNNSKFKYAILGYSDKYYYLYKNASNVDFYTNNTAIKLERGK